MRAIPARFETMRQSAEPFMRFFNGPYTALEGDPDTANFAVGNPHDMPLRGYVDALRRHLEPQTPDWFAYKTSEPHARRVVARVLSARTGLDWDPDDVAMTTGGFAAIAVALRVLLRPGDEAIFLTPPWFFYELLIRAVEAVPVRVALTPPRFEIDYDAIAAAITPRTRLLILNTPHNPGGRVYPLEDLRRLADLLSAAAARRGRPIHLLSDEPYNRIVFDGRTFHSPAEVYPDTLVTYSYGKTLLAPGMRIGYLTVPPTMTGRVELRERVFLEQLAAGWLFPNADLQHAIEDLEALSIDVAALEQRRDRVVSALRDMGYETTRPEGTFYVMARTPIPDDLAFTDLLARRKVLVLPGSVVELPGWLRISLTASDEMIERGLPRFEAALAGSA